MTWLPPVIIGLAVVGFLGLVFRAVNSVRYELRDDALCIVYGPFCVRRIPYSNMVSVRRGIAFWNEHYNRISFDPNITVRLKTGVLIKNLVINPPDTDAFIAALQARIAAA